MDNHTCQTIQTNCLQGTVVPSTAKHCIHRMFSQKFHTFLTTTKFVIRHFKYVIIQPTVTHCSTKPVYITVTMLRTTKGTIKFQKYLPTNFTIDS